MQIFSAIAALPQILTALLQLIGWAEKKMGPDWAQAVVQIGDAFEAHSKAKSEIERRDAIKKLGSIFNSG